MTTPAPTVEPAGTEELREKVDCGIIVVTYNSEQYIEKLLDSIPAATAGMRIRCVVVDNNSQDDTPSIVRSRIDTEFLQVGGNLGYSGGINVGRNAVGPCSSVLILNPDLVLEPRAVSDLHQALGEPIVGVAAPMLCNPDGNLYFSLRHEPSLLNAIGDGLFGAHWPTRPHWLSETVRDKQAYQTPHDAAWTSGAAMLISEECNIAVGDWDSARFFLYSEETDFARRARLCGFHIRYVPTARVHHVNGGSGRFAALTALAAVNRIRYYEKYHGRIAATIFRAIVAFRHLLRSVKPDQRSTLKVVLRRASWAQLPHGSAHDGELEVIQ